MRADTPSLVVLDTNSAGNGTRAMQFAREGGLRTVFLARNPDEYAGHDPSPLEVATEVIEVDTFDVVKVLGALSGRAVHAVLAFDELRIVQAALVNAYLATGCGPSPPSVLTVRFKDLFREALQGTRWDVTFRRDSVRSRPGTGGITYPCVVKPTDEAAGVGVRICRSDADLHDALAALRQLVTQPNGRGYWLTGDYVVEEYLAGAEYSAEMVWSASDDRWVTLGFTTKELGPEPHCVEIGHTFPFSFGAAQDALIASELDEMLRSLGLRSTVAHVEFRWDDTRLRPIEVNPRPAGGEISELVRLAGGVSLVDFFVASHLGTSDELLSRFDARRCARVAFLLPQRPGLIRAFTLHGPVDDRVDKLRIVNTPTWVGYGTSNEDYIARVVASAQTDGEAEAIVRQALSTISPHYAETQSATAVSAS